MIFEDKANEDIAIENLALRQKIKELEGALLRYSRVEDHINQLGKIIQTEQHQFNTLFNLLPIGVSICLDLSCKEIRHNPVASEFLRIDAWDVMSHSVENPPSVRIFRKGKELSPEQMPIQRSVLHGEVIRHEELEFIWEDGVKKTSCWQAAPLYDKAGSIVGAIAVSEDTTEKNQRFELESISDGFFILNGHYQITYISHKAEVFVGNTSEELIGRSIWEVLQSCFGHPVYEHIHELALAGIFTSSEVCSPKINRWFEIITTLGDAGIYIVFRDITLRKAAERQQQINLHRLEALVELNQMYDADINEITHFAYETGCWLTESQVGWLGFLNEDQTQLQIQAHSNNSSTLRQNLDSENLQTFIIKSGGFWAEAIQQRRPVIVNDYSAHSPLKKELPNGHSELKRFLIVPILDKEQVVAVFAVGNKETEYDDSDVYQITLLTSGMWDIIKKREAAEKLRSSEEKFYTAFNSSPIAIAISDINDRTYVDVNDHWLNLFGYIKEEVIGRKTKELNLWADPGTPDQLYSMLKSKKKLYNYEVEFRMRAGKVGLGIASSELISVDGRDSILSTMIDITERKQSEDKLRSSEERFCKTFHSSPVMMAILEMKDNHFIEVNQTYLEQTEYSHEEIIGHSPVELNILIDQKVMLNAINRLEETQRKIDNIEFDIRCKSGKIITVLGSIELIDLNNEKCRLTVLQNITEKKILEANMARMDRLNLIGQMAASIGHEIRNPMTTIRGFMQLLKGWEESKEWKEYSDLIIEELDRANSIITEFLTLAKDKVVNLKLTSLNTVIAAILPLIRSNSLAKDMNVALEYEDIPQILVDEQEIRQLLLNLTRNGLEAMSTGGTLTIRTYQEGNAVVLSIRDQGYGISADMMDKLGTPFVSTKEDGTGLGLAVCYSIVDRHNAQIKIETSSQGTNFMVCFPIPLEQTLF